VRRSRPTHWPHANMPTRGPGRCFASNTARASPCSHAWSASDCCLHRCSALPHTRAAPAPLRAGRQMHIVSPA
jgi:hypothetical protein